MRYETGWREPIIGARIEELRSSLSNTTGPDTVLADFWAEVAANGGPLVAPIAHDDAGVAVSFLWRDETGTVEHVAIGGGLVLNDWEQHLLRRLPGTDVFHLTLRLPRGTRVTYYFAPDIHGHWDPWLETGDQMETLYSFRPDPLNPSSVLDLDPTRDADLTAALTHPATGTLTEHWFTSTLLAAERRYWVYQPPGDGPVEHVLWAFDGGNCLAEDKPPQNLIQSLVTAGQIPRTAIVFIDNPFDSRQAEVTFEVPLDRFVCEELVPDVRTRYAYPSDRSQNTISGFSGGGEAAILSSAHSAAHFGNVIAASPGIAYMQRGHEPREWYARFRLDPASADTRFVLTVGELEVDRVYDIPSLFTAAHEFTDLLRELQFDVTLLTGPVGHDYFSSQILFAHALRHLMTT